MNALVTNVTSSGTFYRPVFSLETVQVLQFITFVVICGPLSSFGIAANVTNMIVFVKQGFKDSMNISLLGLAVADCSSLIPTLWACMCFNPLLMKADLPFDVMDVMYLTGGYSHQIFNRATGSITAFIAIERCLCVIIPLKVKRIITRARTRIIITSIFIVMIAIFSPFYFVNWLELRFSEKWNQTKYVLVYGENRYLVESVIFLIHSVALSGILFLTVILCTVVLIVRLNMNAKWRKKTTSSHAEVESKTKEKRVVKMVALICTIFIVCFTPATLIFFMMGYEPDFSFNGRYQDVYYVVWFVAVCLETFNCSVNCIVYYNMSSKFRETFLQTFQWSMRKHQK